MCTFCLSCAFVALAFDPKRAAATAPERRDVHHGRPRVWRRRSYGAPDAQTPNIDWLAREGVKFTDFYANHANCSPTRTAFISGRYQQRYESNRR